MASTALTRQNVQVETLPAATATDVLKQHPSPITKYLVDNQHLIEPLLPQGVRFLTVVWEVVTALAKDQQQAKPALVHCTPDSVFLAVTKIQAWGLEIGRTAHLVPFGKVCTPIVDYKGDIQLAIDARVITHAKAVAVYEGEEFQYEDGLNPILRHAPSLKAQQRGVLLGFYAILTLPSREKVAHYMPLKDVDDIRLAHSKQWKSGPCPPWYGKKTVIRQALKTVPKSTRSDALLASLQRADTMDIPHATEITASLSDAPTLVQDAAADTIDTGTGEIVSDGAMPTRSLEWARALPLPWKTSPAHGTPIGEFSREHLQSIAAWCEKRLDEGQDLSPANVELYDATQLLLEDIDKAQTTLAVDEPTDLPDLIREEPKGAPPGSLSYKPPPGGKVEDAYRMSLGDEKKPNTDALRNG